jgi:hypothetical protein
MDKVSKMLASAPGFQKKRDRDNLFRSTEASPTPAAAAEPKAETSFTEKLQIPVTPDQWMIVSQIAKQLQSNRGKIDKSGRREGESINKSTIVRCLIQLLDGVEITPEDRAFSEDEVFEILKNKLGIK